MDVTAHHFEPHDLVGGHLALDLVNTVTARDSHPHDWLADYAGLLKWGSLAGALPAREQTTLARRATAEPAAARAALGRLRRLREALHGVLTALQAGRAPPAPALQILEQARQAALRRSVLAAADDGAGTTGATSISARPTLDAAGFDLVADRVLVAALALLEAPPLPRLRCCDGPHCGWLFVDQSKAGRRRWCDMATCGAAQKAQKAQRLRAHPQRQQET